MIQPYDILMLAVLVLATLWGVHKGMAWQLASLAALVLSAVVAVHGSTAVAPYIKISDQESWNRFAAMLLLYVVTAAAIWILFRLVKGLIDRVQLKEFDRQLGAVFGLAKGLLYCVLITFFAVTLSEPARLAVIQSRSGYFIARAIERANPLLPEDVRAVVGKYIDELEQKLHAPPQEAPPGQEGPAGPADGRGEAAKTPAH